jgi:predicted acyltransferase
MNTQQRYLALDVFRGLTIATMITVNNPGSWSHIYAPLKHSAWHGCTPTDLVFPFFLFIVGVSAFFSFKKYETKLTGASFLKILKRTALIFLIGLFLNSFPQWMTDWPKLRILGVLQRIAMAYFFGSLIVLAVKRKYLPWISLAILLAYWGILWFFGGDDPYSLAGNIAPKFDSFIIGESHLYKGFGLVFDPEGLLSTIPAIVTVIIGFIAGGVISETEKQKVPVKMILYGVVLTAAGLESGIPDQQTSVDKLLCGLYCWTGICSHGNFYLDNRSERIYEMDIAVCCVRYESSVHLCFIGYMGKVSYKDN